MDAVEAVTSNSYLVSEILCYLPPHIIYQTITRVCKLWNDICKDGLPGYTFALGLRIGDRPRVCVSPFVLRHASSIVCRYPEKNLNVFVGVPNLSKYEKLKSVVFYYSLPYPETIKELCECRKLQVILTS